MVSFSETTHTHTHNGLLLIGTHQRYAASRWFAVGTLVGFNCCGYNANNTRSDEKVAYATGSLPRPQSNINIVEGKICSKPWRRDPENNADTSRVYCLVQVVATCSYRDQRVYGARALAYVSVCMCGITEKSWTATAVRQDQLFDLQFPSMRGSLAGSASSLEEL